MKNKTLKIKLALLDEPYVLVGLRSPTPSILQQGFFLTKEKVQSPAILSRHNGRLSGCKLITPILQAAEAREKNLELCLSPLTTPDIFPRKGLPRLQARSRINEPPCLCVRVNEHRVARYIGLIDISFCERKDTLSNLQ